MKSLLKRLLTRKQGIGPNTLALLAANCLNSVLGFVRGFYVARYLLPAEYGVWSLISALLNYANYADVGINTGMILEVPKLIGQGHLDEAQHVQRQAYTATLMVTGVLVTLVTLISFTPLLANAQQATIIRIAVVAVLVFALLNYYNLAVRIEERFVLIGVSVVVTAVVSFGAIVGASLVVVDQRVQAVALASLVGPAVAVLLLSQVTRSPLTWPLDLQIVWRLLKIGLPVSLLPMGFTLFQSLDRWVVAANVPAATMGYYGLGTTIGLFLYMLPNTLAYVLFTRQIEHFGATGDPKASESLVSAPLLFGGYSMALVAGGVALAMPFIVHHLVPAYLPGTRSAIFHVIGNCVLFAVPVASNFLISTGRQRQLFGALAVGMMVKAGLVFVLVRTAWGIDGAALAVLISDVVYGGLVAFLAVRLFGATLLGQVRRVASYFLPFAVCLPVAVWLLNAGSPSGAFWADLGRLVGQGALFVLICGPLFLLAAWASGLLRQPVVARRLRRVIPARLVGLKGDGGLFAVDEE